MYRPSIEEIGPCCQSNYFQPAPTRLHKFLAKLANRPTFSLVLIFVALYGLGLFVFFALVIDAIGPTTLEEVGETLCMTAIMPWLHNHFRTCTPAGN